MKQLITILILFAFANGMKTKGQTALIEERDNGEVNWTGQYIEATGTSIIDRQRWTVPGQAEEMAKRGAVVIAQRNLLEITKGVKVTSTTTVKDMITQSDVIVTQLEGVIKGAQMAGEPKITQTSVEVTLRMPMYAQNGIAPVLAKSTNEIGKSEQAVSAELQNMELTGTITALALNVLGNKEISPNMFPKFVDENGNLLLDLAKIYDPTKGTFPVFEKKSNNKNADLLDITIDSLGNFVVNKIQRPKLKKFVNALFQVGGVALKILL